MKYSMSTSHPITISSSCIRCGSCVASYPELFEFDEKGLSARVKADADFSGKNLEEIKSVCPNGAIVDAKPDSGKPVVAH